MSSHLTVLSLWVSYNFLNNIAIITEVASFSSFTGY